MRHLVPFQRSATRVPPRLVKVNPIAVQAAGLEQDTAVSWVPGGLGTGWRCQAVPFQRSANAPWSELPTARHALGPVQVRPGSWANWVPAGLGVGWTAQLLPFHRSAT